MKMGTETICYQHQQAQDILEELLKTFSNPLVIAGANTNSKLKEAIEWITKANDSAVRMENKLIEYKQLIGEEDV